MSRRGRQKQQRDDNPRNDKPTKVVSTKEPQTNNGKPQKASTGSFVSWNIQFPRMNFMSLGSSNNESSSPSPSSFMDFSFPLLLKNKTKSLQVLLQNNTWKNSSKLLGFDKFTKTTKPKVVLPSSINRTIHQFVIQTDRETGEWEFRNMFVLEFTTFNMVLLSMIVFFWVINRQTHMRPTRGSKITHVNKNKQKRLKNSWTSDDDDDVDDYGTASSDDDDVDGNDNDDHSNKTTIITGGTQQQQQQLGQSKTYDSNDPATSSPAKYRRQSTRQQRLTLIHQMADLDTEQDEDDYHYGFGTVEGVDEFFYSADDSRRLEEIPLTKEKRGLLKVLKQIKVFSYLEDEAMALCLEHVEFYNYKAKDSIFVRGNYDGSLYAIMSGKVRCRFHKYPLPEDEASDPEEYDVSCQRLFGDTFEKGDVMTSILAMMAGMASAMVTASTQKTTTNTTTINKNESIRQLLGTIMPIAKDMSAVALEDDTQLIRISPTCFAKVMEKYPSNVYRIAQTALNRAQRLTVLTLVQTLGLRKELIVVPPSSEMTNNTNTKKNEQQEEIEKENATTKNDDNKSDDDINTIHLSWGGFFGNHTENNDNDSNKNPAGNGNNPVKATANDSNDQIKSSELEKQKQQACLEFAKLLGIPIERDGTESIKILQEYSEIVTYPAGHVLIHTGDVHDACFLLLQGTMEMGLQLPIAGAGRAALKPTSTPTTAAVQSPSKQQKQQPPPHKEWQFQSFQRITPGSHLIGEHTCFTGDLSLFHIECSRSSENTSSTETTMSMHSDTADKNDKDDDKKFDNSCTLLKVPRHVYLHLIRRHPLAMAKSLMGILQQVSSEVHLLNWTSEWMYVEAAQEIVRRGDPCDSMFVVLNGRVRAAVSSRKKRQDPRVQDIEYGRGKIVGEVGCLTRTRWGFNLYAIRNSEIVRVQMRTLLVIIGEFPKAGMHFARAIAGKVAEHYSIPTNTVSMNIPRSSVGVAGPMPTGAIMNDASGAATTAPKVMRSYGLRLATIAVVPLTDSVSVDKFSSCLVSSLAEIAPCKLLTKQLIRGELGEKVYRNRNELRKLRITRLLADMEENNRLVVYQADQKYTWWTRLCIQQADCILLVVNAERAPSLRRVEQSLEWAHESINVRIDLVVIGSQNQDVVDDEENSDYETDPTEEDDDDEEMTVSDQLNNWSEKRKWISGHHLVRKPFRRYPMDFRRMCRRVTGRAVGLVLGAGGARGIAHVGVIKALKEAGVTVDLVGGTSQGAFVGALFARQPDDYKKCEEDCRKMAKDMSSIRNKIFDLTLPMTSMFCGRLFNRGIRKRLGKIRIQDLVLNFFCVSVDLQKQQQVVHTKGILWKYCRASMSLTQYLPPVAENGTLLVDGAYMNTLPVDVMRQQMNPRIIIAVDVSPELEREYYDYGTSLSGWWLLWNSWNPFAKTVKVPSMGDISDMLIWVSSERHRRSVKIASDLYLSPPVTGVGTLEYDRFDELVQLGYDYAKPLVDEFVRKNPWIVTEKPKPRMKKSPSQGESK